MFIRDTLTTPSAGLYSPLKSNLEDMIHTCEELDKQLDVIAEDGEEFGLLSEESFCYTAPQVLHLLHKISRVAGLCTREINVDDEAVAFSTDEGSLSLAVYNFISEHRRMLDHLTAQQNTLKNSGSFFEGLAQCLQRQQLMLNAFRAALDNKFQEVKVRSAPDWIDLSETMQSALEAYPVSEPSEPED